MENKKHISFKFPGRTLAVIALISLTTVAAFATLGDGRVKKSKPGQSLLTNKTKTTSFSLRSGYSFRGSQVINTQAQNFVSLNTVLTYQKGNTTYIVPLKKKVLLPNVKVDISNRQFRHN
ncbi:MAG: hypothetical protein J0L56_08495 [Chitinophagales bacterium]|nr:hypothetical protein [Chitinophagales bacterium]